MKKFIIKLIGFAIVPSLLVVMSIAVNIFLTDFAIDKSADILILGHSHPECAYDDSIIKGVVNRSCSGEAYFYTYYKTKLLLECNPQIKHVLLEFSNNQIFENRNDWIWGDKSLKYRFPKYASFMDLEGFSFLLKNNPRGFVTGLFSWLFRYNFKNMGTAMDSELQGYHFLKREFVDSIKSVNSINAEPKSVTKGFSRANLVYLKKVIDYCLSRNIRIDLIRSPVHKSYGGSRNEAFFQYLVCTDFSSLKFYDFFKFPLSDHQFGDLEHLNYKGAREFSEWFNKAIEGGLLDIDEHQLFIDNEIERRNSQFGVCLDR